MLLGYWRLQLFTAKEDGNMPNLLLFPSVILGIMYGSYLYHIYNLLSVIGNVSRVTGC